MVKQLDKLWHVLLLRIPIGDHCYDEIYMYMPESIDILYPIFNEIFYLLLSIIMILLPSSKMIGTKSINYRLVCCAAA